MTYNIQIYNSVDPITGNLITTSVLTASVVSADKIQATFDREFKVEPREDGTMLVYFANHPEHNQVKRWFEKRKLIVRLSQKVGRRYEVVTDRETALLAKLTWGGNT